MNALTIRGFVCIATYASLILYGIGICWYCTNHTQLDTTW